MNVISIIWKGIIYRPNNRKRCFGIKAFKSFLWIGFLIFVENSALNKMYWYWFYRFFFFRWIQFFETFHFFFKKKYIGWRHIFWNKKLKSINLFCPKGYFLQFKKEFLYQNNSNDLNYLKHHKNKIWWALA